MEEQILVSESLLSKISVALLIVSVAASVFSILFSLRFDVFINNDLYNFGLEYSSEWAGQYHFDFNLLLFSTSHQIVSNAK